MCCDVQTRRVTSAARGARANVEDYATAKDSCERLRLACEIIIDAADASHEARSSTTRVSACAPLPALILACTRAPRTVSQPAKQSADNRTPVTTRNPSAAQLRIAPATRAAATRRASFGPQRSHGDATAKPNGNSQSHASFAETPAENGRRTGSTRPSGGAGRVKRS